MLMPGL